jgi:uncharacterized protein YggE
VQTSDINTISFNVYNLYSPILPALPHFGAVPQAAQAGVMQPEMQYGSYQVRSTMRVNVRETGRVGEVVDAVTRAGANIVGAFCFKVNDEANARRAALEAAGKDARAKAESLATATGRQVGDAVTVTEDIIVSNGAYAALRSAIPFAFGPGTPQTVGELEYYARVSANFRFQGPA